MCGFFIIKDYELQHGKEEHLKPQPIFIAKEYRFYCRDQNENETISDYITVLQKLNLNCNVREFLGEALRDRFVCGLTNSSIRRRLLGEWTPTSKKATELAKPLQKAEVEIKLINTEIKAENTFAVKPKSWRCCRCNSVEHLSNTCPFKE